MSYKEKENIEELRKQCERDKLAIQTFWEGVDPYDSSFAEELNKLWEDQFIKITRRKKL